MAIFEAIRKLLRSFASALFGEASGSTLEPSELTKAVLDAAEEKAKDWDDQLDLPNSFEVLIPKAEWDSYYGSRVRQTEDRLAKALTQFASEIGAVMEDPVVTITVGGDVASGVVVRATFSAPSGLSATPVFGMGGNGGTSEGAAGWATTPTLASETARDETPVGQAKPTSVTPRLAPQVAYVRVPDGPSFEVGAGSTVGIVRDPSRERPEIKLPYADSLQTCSQLQGRFERRGTEWSFVNTGRNGTRVLRNSEMSQVEESPFVLRDNDMLFFGASEDPALVFFTKVS